jgi:hypothetical protein
VGYTLFDSDNSSDNATYNNLYTNSATITILDNLTAYDNESGVNGTGIVAYFFTDNVTTATNLRDNTSGLTALDNWQSGSSYGVNLDNTTNRLVTIYGYAKDLAGNISDNATQTIAFDNATPVIDNLTWIGGPQIQKANSESGNVTLYLFANDNESSGASNYSSGWKDFYIAYEVKRSGSVISSASLATVDLTNESDWKSFSTVLGVSSDNLSFDNASYTLDIAAASGRVFDIGSGSSDNLTVVVWVRDNASNISDNYTTIFSLDNTTDPYYPNEQ